MNQTTEPAAEPGKWAAFKAKAAPFIARWQEFIVWLPGLVVLALVGYIILGAFAAVPTNMIEHLSNLPMLCAYAAAACAFTYLVKRTYMHELKSRDERKLHESAMLGNRGALIVLAVDRLATLAVLGMLLHFFRVVR